MNLKIRWLLLLVALGIGAQTTAADSGEARASLVFSGFFALGDGKQFVSLSSPDATPRWLPVGGSYVGYKIVRFDQENSVLLLADSAGAEFRLPLRAAVIAAEARSKPIEAVQATAGPRVKLPGSPAGKTASAGALKESEIVDVFPPKGSVRSAEGLDWDWILSDENPMRRLATIPSQSESRRFATMSAEERAALTELYRQCGWHQTVFVKANGRVAVNCERINPPGSNLSGSSGSIPRFPPERN